MSIQPLEIVLPTEEEIVSKPDSFTYCWTCLIFALLTALAIYVMFTIPLGEI